MTEMNLKVLDMINGTKIWPALDEWKDKILFLETIIKTTLIKIIKDVIIYNEVTNLTRTFASLLNHNVFINILKLL